LRYTGFAEILLSFGAIGIEYFPIFSGLRRILKSLIMGLAAGVLTMGEYIDFFLPSSDNYPWEEYCEYC